MTAKSGKWLRFRVVSILVLFFVLYVALASRAFQLQVISGETLGKLADRQHKKSLTLYPERRFIFDRNGQKLAATIMADSVYVDPSSVEDRRNVSSKLSSILGVKRQKNCRGAFKPGEFPLGCPADFSGQGGADTHLEVEGCSPGAGTP